MSVNELNPAKVSSPKPTRPAPKRPQQRTCPTCDKPVVPKVGFKNTLLCTGCEVDYGTCNVCKKFEAGYDEGARRCDGCGQRFCGACWPRFLYPGFSDETHYCLDCMDE